MHYFHRSLVSGKAGEALLASLMPELEALNGKGSDFKHRITGDLWELKTDSYDMLKTSNFFVERYGNDKKMSNGGPWQALEHRSKYWVYMFPVNKTLFIFNTQELVHFLDNYKGTFPVVNIPNKGYNTIGYKVPRDLLKHLYEERSF